MFRCREVWVSTELFASVSFVYKRETINKNKNTFQGCIAYTVDLSTRLKVATKSRLGAESSCAVINRPALQRQLSTSLTIFRELRRLRESRIWFHEYVTVSMSYLGIKYSDQYSTLNMQDFIGYHHIEHSNTTTWSHIHSFDMRILAIFTWR